MLDFTYIVVGVGQHSDNTKANCKSASRNRFVTSLSITETHLLLVLHYRNRFVTHLSITETDLLLSRSITSLLLETDLLPSLSITSRLPETYFFLGLSITMTSALGIRHEKSGNHHHTCQAVLKNT